MSKYAITKKHPGRASAIITAIGIDQPLISNKQITTQLKYNALWDTGATATCISNKIVQELGLKPITYTQVYGVNGQSQAPVFVVSVHVLSEGKLVVPQQRVILANLESQDFDVIIGMDIISQGDFAISGYQGKSCFSFRYPALEEIDFLKNKTIMNETPTSPSRNKPCPCGSGKKYKHCHGKNE